MDELFIRISGYPWTSIQYPSQPITESWMSRFASFGDCLISKPNATSEPG
jgi:hypothetical protein